MPQPLAVIRLLVPSDKICAVKNILEGYDNLAVVTTVDRMTGEILIRHQYGEEDAVAKIVGEVCGRAVCLPVLSGPSGS